MEQHFVVVVVILHFLTSCKGDITLVSSLDGRRAALPNEQLTFSCTISGNTLVWKSTLSTNFIGFIRSVHEEGISRSQQDVGFVAVLNSKANGAMNSTLQFTVNQTFNRTAVQCTNGAFTPVANKTLFVAAIPDAPININISNHTLSSATLEWSCPPFDGLDSIVRYVVGVISGGAKLSTMDSDTTYITIPSLQYSRPYTFEVKSVNRVGASPGAVYNFTIVPEDPPSPANLTLYEHCGRTASLTFMWQLPQLSDLVPGPISVAVNITQLQLTTEIQLQPNVFTCTVYNVRMSIALYITVYVKSLISKGKGTNMVLRISDHITSSKVFVEDTTVSVVCTTCYLSSSVLFLLYRKCDNGANSGSYSKAATELEGGVYQVNISSLSPNTTYCYTAVLYDPATSQPIGSPFAGIFVTNVSLPVASILNSATDSNRSISIRTGEDRSYLVGGTAAGAVFLGLTVLLLVSFPVSCCYLKRRKTKLEFTIEVERSEPHRYFDTIKPGDVDAVLITDNVAYCTVAMAKQMKDLP